MGGFFTSSLKGRLREWIIFIFFFFLFSSPSFAQSQIKTKTTKIEILGANSFEMDKGIAGGAKRLIGDVRLKHEGALMYCDSAYVYSKTNDMDAFGHVKIVQGDSLQLFGDSLKYNGNTKIAQLRGNIRLINNDVTLTTNYLDYNRTDNIAYYFGGGKMVSRKEKNTLTSRQGYYHSDSQSFYFKDSVLLINPEYRIEADTLNYHSTSKVVHFLGPTTITNEDNFIYTEDGWYNTISNKSKFYKNAYLYSENKIIEGDTLYYDRNKGFGKIVCNGIITDTLENIILKGDVVHFFEKQDSAMITQEALLMQLDKKDTLFMHADTFKISTQYVIIDSLLSKGEANNVDTIRTLFAYNHVKFFKSDMQGKSDSVIYNFSDSTINFYNNPIIWSKENQLTSDFTFIQMANGKPHSIYMNENAFIISKPDSLLDNFNQIKGKNMVGYFKEESLHKISVKQNSETIYYAVDDDGKYIGVNKMRGEDMLIFFKDNEIQTITFINKPQGEMNPIKEVSPKDVILKGFNWRITERPNDMFDIFIP
jgi:lipopolysaccharide export system protein LptA